MPRVNPAILVWARETAGLTHEEAAVGLGIRNTRKARAIEKLEALESGHSTPSRAMLAKIAKVYRRPLLVFYMSEPPRRGARGQDFPTLPAGYTVADDALVDALIRDVRMRQGIVREALEAEEEAEPHRYVGSIPLAAGISSALSCLNTTLGMRGDEFRDAPTIEEAFRRLRERAERAGVYVILQGDLGSRHSAISAETFRGFAFADQVAPFVVINDQDSPSAWAFTLLHELVHICLGETGVSRARSETALETFCNEVASSFLLDDEELAGLRITDATDCAPYPGSAERPLRQAICRHR
jgi:transcriptional regulator with XRE-family HTH domain